MKAVKFQTTSGEEIAINPAQISTINAYGENETQIRMADGLTYLVKDPIDTVIDKMLED